MRGGTSPRGYTIVEVMIFLAITGVMFLMAVAFVSGKQATVQFRQGMNDINSTVQQVINDVSNGDYTSSGNFSCQVPLSSVGPPVFPPSTPTPIDQGANYGCIFLGKVIQFGGDTNGANPAAYNIYTIAGRQFAPYGTNATTLSAGFADAQGAVIAPPATTSANDLTQYLKLTWGLNVTKMTSTTVVGSVTTVTPIDAVGFFGSLNGNSGGTILQSGPQTVNVVVFSGTHEISPAPPPPSETVANMIDDINTELDLPAPGTTPLSNPNILICFNGGTNQYGSLTIGSDVNSTNGQRLTTSIQISNSQVSGC